MRNFGSPARGGWVPIVLAAWLQAVACVSAAVAQQSVPVAGGNQQKSAAEASATSADKKFPTPSAAAVKAAAAKVKSVFGSDLAAASTAEKKTILARKIAATADESGDAAEKWVLYNEAIKLAADAGDLTAAFSLVGGLEAKFAFPAIELKIELLEKSVPKADVAKLGELWRLAVDMAAIADHNGDVPTSTKLLTLAGALARKSRNTELIQQTQRITAEMRERAKATAELEEAKQRWSAAPSDPEANRDLGLLLCFKHGDWEAGLPLLVKSGDTGLAGIATAEMRSGSNAGTAVALADRWMDWSKREKGWVKDGAAARAAELYAAAISSLKGLDRAAVQRKIDELGALPARGTVRTKDGPKTLPGLIVWLDSTERGSVVTEGAGAKGKTVARWKDLSGNGNDAVQAESDKRPFFNGSTIEFAGAQWMTQMRPLGSAALTLVVDYEAAPGATGDTVITTMADSTVGSTLIHEGNDRSVIFRSYDRGHQQLALPPKDGRRTFIGSVSQLGMTAQFVGDQAKSAAGDKPLKPSPVPLTIGKDPAADYRVGFKGRIARVLVFSRSLEPAELEALGKWLGKQPF